MVFRVLDVSRFLVASLVALILATGSVAVSAGDRPAAEPVALPPGGVYRYQNEDGQMVMSHTLPEEAILAGYEVLNRAGRVVHTVAAPPDEAERARIRERREARDREVAQQQRDQELRRLYTGAEDAVRARDRQMNALRLAVDYARNSISQVQTQLDEEIAAAARAERAGRPIPDGVEANIDRYTRQLQELEADVEQQQREMEQVAEQFRPVIERLEYLEQLDKSRRRRAGE